MIAHIHIIFSCLFRRLMDPSNLKLMIGNMLHGVCGRISDYLDGDLSAAMKFPEFMRDLDEELEEEENSEWCSRRLGSNVPIEEEEKWREIISKMFAEDNVPHHVYPDKKFLGGKQFQRAVQLLNATMMGEITWLDYLLYASPATNSFIDYFQRRCQI